MPHTITERDMRFVHMLAARHYSGSDDYEDTVADGMVGLVQAAERFDPDQGVKFTSYATGRIRGAMTDGKRARDPLTRGDRTRQDARGDEMRSLAANVIPLDAPVATDDGQWDLADLTADPESPDPLEVVLADETRRERVTALKAAIATLPEGQRRVLHLRVVQDLSGPETADALGLVIGSVYAYQCWAIAKLRRDMADMDALAA